MRSGWKYSSWSSFSPTDANLIGFPVTALTERAAPPRASPSSFVRTTPSNATLLVERLRDGHGLLARHRVEHEQDVRRLRGVPDSGELLHQLLVDVEPPGRVEDDHVLALIAGLLDSLC